MKRIVFTLAALAAFAVFGLTDTERQYLRNLAQRPRCEARTPVVIGGVTNIVETWRRGGYEWKQTNVVRRVIGKTQTNTFEQRLAELREIAAQWQDRWSQATNRADIAEAKVARMEAFKAWLVEQRDKAALPTTKALYQAIIDKLEDNR